MTLDTRTVAAAKIRPALAREMLALMQTYYEGVTPEAFRRDLREKDRVILLERGGHLAGFSTLMLFEQPVHGRVVRVVFSGDTIIDRESWGSPALPVAFGRELMALHDERPDVPLYWFLISKGYKTYRYLPVFFRRFYPRHDAACPAFESALIRTCGRRKYPERFDAAHGVVRANCQRLKLGVADITDARRADPHVAFFERANPEHARGDELACVARFDRDNLKPMILRYILSP